MVTLCDTLWTSEPFHAKGMAAAWQIGRLDIGCRKADIPRPISCEQRTIRSRAKGIAGGPNATCNFEYLILTAIFCRIYGFPDTTCCIYCLYNIMHTYIVWCIVCIALATHESSPTNNAPTYHQHLSILFRKVSPPVGSPNASRPVDEASLTTPQPLG